MTNKYNGKCSVCSKTVYAGTGVLDKDDLGKWLTLHVECALGSPEEVADDLDHAAAYDKYGAEFDRKVANKAVVLSAWRDEKVEVEGSYRQSAWYNETDYTVPAKGLSAEDWRSALYDAWRTSLTGWSVGGYTTPNVKDNGDGTLTVTTVYHIGD